MKDSGNTLLFLGIPTNHIDQVLNSCGMASMNFLVTPLSHGLITTELKNHINLHHRHASKLLPIITAGFINALHSEIWKPRTHIIQKENDRLGI